MKMKNRIVIFLLLVTACNTSSIKEQTTESSRNIKISLVDSLGQVSLSIPARYDTVFSWIDYSDCGKPCNRQEYRCQPRTLPITKESGYFWLNEPKDSVDRFTIIHTSDVQDFPDTIAVDSSMFRYLRHKIADDPNYPEIIHDTIEKIGGRYFSIFIMMKSDTIHNIRVLAGTTVKGNEVYFRCDLLSKKDDSISRNFIKNSLDLIHTIRINKGIDLP